MIEKDLKDQYITQKTILMYIFATHVHHEKKVELKILYGLIRKIYPKSFDFSTISQDVIDNEIKKINEIYRETLGFHSVKERYNELSLINWAL